MKVKTTDHDRCIQILLDYVKSKPLSFRLLQDPSPGIEQGPDLLFLNSMSNCVEYVEVELDAKSSVKATRMAKRAELLHQRHKKPVRVWMVSSSDKWVASEKEIGVSNHVNKELLQSGAVSVFRISPLDLGIYSIKP
jgi:hypothetical protein